MKKKNLFLPLVTVTAIVFVPSCTHKEVPNKNGKKNATVEIAIVSAVRAAGGTQGGSADENKIEKIEAYTFNASGNLVDYIAVPAPIPSRITLKAESGNATVALVANATTGSQSTLGALNAAVGTWTFDYSNNTVVPADGFVMSDGKGIYLNEGENSTSISVKRTVSKFERPTFTGTAIDLSGVELNKIREVFPGFGETSDRAEIEFSYTGYALANGLNKTLVMNESNAGWPAQRTTWYADKGLAYLNSAFEGTGSYALTNGVYSGAMANPAAVYVHENFPYADFTSAGSTITAYNPEEVYCFVIEGKLIWNATEVPRYWRVNLLRQSGTGASQTDDNYKVYRNGVYTVNIDEIRTVGHKTPIEAEEEMPVINPAGETSVSITVTAVDWDVFISNTQM